MHTRSSLLRKSLLLPNCSVHSSKLHVIPNSSRKTTLLEAGPKSECPGHTARHVMQCVCVCLRVRMPYVICTVCQIVVFIFANLLFPSCSFMTSWLTLHVLTLQLGCRVGKAVGIHS